MIYSFILLYSFYTSFSQTNTSWSIYGSIKTLEIETFIPFNFDFGNNTILSCFFFFLIIDLNLLVRLPYTFAVIAQIFNLISELAIPIGIPSKDAKAEIEIHPVIAEAKIRMCSK